MRSTEVSTPVTSSDRDDAELSDDDGGTDSSGHFLGGLDTQTNVALGVTNDDDGLESGSLTGTGLLLDGLDLFGEKIHVSQSDISLCVVTRYLRALSSPIAIL